MTLNLDKAKDRARLASLVALADTFGVCIMIQCREATPTPKQDGRRGAKHPRLKQVKGMQSRHLRTAK